MLRTLWAWIAGAAHLTGDAQGKGGADGGGSAASGGGAAEEAELESLLAMFCLVSPPLLPL